MLLGVALQKPGMTVCYARGARRETRLGDRQLSALTVICAAGSIDHSEFILVVRCTVRRGLIWLRTHVVRDLKSGPLSGPILMRT